MKKNVLIVLCILVVALCGCVPYTFYEEPYTTDSTRPTYDALQTRIPIPTFPLRTQSTSTTAPARATWTPIPTKKPSPTSSTKTPVPTKAPVTNTKIANKVQLMQFINNNIANGTYQVTFQYTGGEKLDYAEVCRMSAGISSVNITEKNDVYNVKLNPYPSKRILEAYYSGNTSKLNSDELKAYNKAVKIVNDAKAKYSDLIDREVYIHDYLIDTVEYDDHTREVTDVNNPPHNLTVVGALVDGRANCQGYSDAFYTLATMLGFEVSYMSVSSNGDLHQVNTVKLNGYWYVVDVTFDDLDGVSYNKSAKTYYLFNAGLDRIFDLSWPDFNEVNPIAKKTSNYFYYNYYGKQYNNVDAFASVVANAWKAGVKEVHGTIPSGAAPKNLESALNNAINSVTDQSVSYSYWYNTDGTVYYYQVLFE